MNMMGTTRRVTPGKRESATDPGLVLAGIAITVLAVISIVLVSSVHLSGADNAPINPAALTLSIAQDKTPWTGAMTAIAVAETLLLVGLATASVWLYVRRSNPAARDFDRAASLMGRGRQIEFLTERGALAKAATLGVPRAFGPGLPLGKAVAGGKRLYSNWETCTVDIWGPRRGKTLSRIIPGILAAPGAVLATSNKYDYMVKATRALRRRMGRIWLFDLQKIANHEPDFWWNPLTYITDDDTAEKAVSVLAVDGVPTGGGGGGSAEFFHKAASRLLKCLLLAAALDRKPAPIVAAWTAIPTDASEAAEILDRHGWPRLANEVRAAVASPSDQRGGVFETALNWASVFTMSTVQAWITDPGDGRPHFDPDAFVRSKDTAYVLSRGKGDGSSAGPIATLLTVAVCEAAEQFAAEQGGRLQVPLVCQLDEAGNVLRWPAMAEKYTHYGSRGILLSAMFQSWSQGVATFGKEGWSTLWDAAGVAIYGGGIKDTDPLDDFSQLIGQYQYQSVSRSSGGGGGSTSRSTQTERVLDVADLGAIPFGRVIAFGGSAAPVLIETEFWFNTPLGKKAQQATDEDDAAATKTLLDLNDGGSAR